MIKYIGSKRAVVPLLEGLARHLPIASACDMFAGTTRVGQAFRRAGCRVVSNDLASYSEAFGQAYIAADDTLDRIAPAADAGRAAGAAGRPGLRHRDLLRAGPLLLPGQRGPHRRHPGGDRRGRRRTGAARLPADQPDRGRRPGRFDLRAADGLSQAAGPPQPPAAGAARAGAGRGPGRDGDARGGQRPGARARRRGLRVPRSRPTTSTPTSRTTTPGRRSPAATGPSRTASRASGSTAGPRAAPSTARATPGPPSST